jgi:hypothetical protein
VDALNSWNTGCKLYWLPKNRSSSQQGLGVTYMSLVGYYTHVGNADVVYVAAAASNLSSIVSYRVRDKVGAAWKVRPLASY